MDKALVKSSRKDVQTISDGPSEEDTHVSFLCSIHDAGIVDGRPDTSRGAQEHLAYDGHDDGEGNRRANADEDLRQGIGKDDE